MHRSRILMFTLVLMAVFLYGRDRTVGQAKHYPEKPSGLALEITSPGVFPFTMTIYQDGIFETSWSGDIPRTEVLPIDENQKGINIPFKISLDGKDVKVEIRMELANFKEIPVGTYIIRPNEKVLVKEVSAYGYAPFSLRIVPMEIKPPVVIPSLTSLPKIENKLKTVKVVGLEKSEFRDHYDLSLLNTSTKNVISLEIIMPTGGISRERSELGKPLIASGAIYKDGFSASTVGRITDNGFEPSSTQPTGVINAALFEDGTHEGDFVSAAIMDATNNGHLMQRKRIILLLNEILVAAPKEMPIKLETVKDRIYSLVVEGDSPTLEEIVKRYLPLKDKLKYVEDDFKAAMAYEKYELIDQIKAYEEGTHTPDGDDLRSWLKKTKENYENLVRKN